MCVSPLFELGLVGFLGVEQLDARESSRAFAPDRAIGDGGQHASAVATPAEWVQSDELSLPFALKKGSARASKRQLANVTGAKFCSVRPESRQFRAGINNLEA
jgi:hypothetical protein